MQETELRSQETNNKQRWLNDTRTGDPADQVDFLTFNGKTACDTRIERSDSEMDMHRTDFNIRII